MTTSPIMVFDSFSCCSMCLPCALSTCISTWSASAAYSKKVRDKLSRSLLRDWGRFIVRIMTRITKGRVPSSSSLLRTVKAQKRQARRDTGERRLDNMAIVRLCLFFLFVCDLVWYKPEVTPWLNTHTQAHFSTLTGALREGEGGHGYLVLCTCVAERGWVASLPEPSNAFSPCQRCAYRERSKWV